jgi:hypothetical protein
MKSGYDAEDRLSSGKVVATPEVRTLLAQLSPPMLDVVVDVQAEVEQFAAWRGLLRLLGLKGSRAASSRLPRRARASSPPVPPNRN